MSCLTPPVCPLKIVIFCQYLLYLEVRWVNQLLQVMYHLKDFAQILSDIHTSVAPLWKADDLSISISYDTYMCYTQGRSKNVGNICHLLQINLFIDQLFCVMLGSCTFIINQPISSVSKISTNRKYYNSTKTPIKNHNSIVFVFCGNMKNK